jgi:serine/threonine-protein kinase
MTYEMLAGEPPHTGTSAQAVIAKLMTTQPQPVRTLRPTVPPNVAMAVEQGLAKLPADRFGSAKAFSDALTNASFTTSVQPATMLASPRRRRGVELALGAIAALSLASAGWMWMHRGPPARVERYGIEIDSVEAITGGGRWGRVAISPDGSIIVYVGGRTGGLLMRRRDQLHASPIPGANSAGTPCFSPDGSHIAFIQGAARLMIVGLDGAPPVFVTDSLVGLGGLYWARDGMIYADAQGAAPLVRVPARAGGIPERFITLDSTAAERDQVFPSVLPDGAVMFTASIRPADGSPERQTIAIADRGTGKHHLVVDDARFARYVAPGSLIYVTMGGLLMAAPFDLGARKITGPAVVLADDLSRQMNSTDVAISETGTLLYFGNAVRSTERELVWVSRDGGVQPVDSSWHGEFSDAALSPDGTRIAVTNGVTTNVDLPSSRLPGTGTTDIWLKRLDNGVVTKLTVEGGDSRFPAWSPNGKSVLYAGGPTRQSIVEKPADGSARPTIRLKSDDQVQAMAESPDGQWLIYQSGTGNQDTRVYAKHGDSAAAPLLSGRTRFPALSPDGKWLAYTSTENGVTDVFVVPFPNVGSAKWQVSRRGGADAFWSTRGGELFYRDGDRVLVSVPVSTHPTFSTGAPKRLFSTTPFLARPAISRDDQRFLMIRPLTGVSRERLTVYENWTAAMNRK